MAIAEAGKRAGTRAWGRTLQAAVRIVSVAGVMLGVSTVGYLLWKTRFVTRFAPIGNDLIEYPIIASAIGALGCLMLFVIFRRRRWLVPLAVAVLAMSALYAFHAAQMACAMKLAGSCVRLWHTGHDR